MKHPVEKVATTSFGSPIKGRYRYRGVVIFRDDHVQPGKWGHWKTLHEVRVTSPTYRDRLYAHSRAELLADIDALLDKS